MIYYNGKVIGGTYHLFSIDENKWDPQYRMQYMAMSEGLYAALHCSAKYGYSNWVVYLNTGELEGEVPTTAATESDYLSGYLYAVAASLVAGTSLITFPEVQVTHSYNSSSSIKVGWEFMFAPKVISSDEENAIISFVFTVATSGTVTDVIINANDIAEKRTNIVALLGMLLGDKYTMEDYYTDELSSFWSSLGSENITGILNHTTRTFNIDGTSYTTKHYMKWTDWTASSYNETLQASCDENCVWNSSKDKILYRYATAIAPTSSVVNNSSYSFAPVGHTVTITNAEEDTLKVWVNLSIGTSSSTSSNFAAGKVWTKEHVTKIAIEGNWAATEETPEPEHRYVKIVSADGSINTQIDVIAANEERLEFEVTQDLEITLSY